MNNLKLSMQLKITLVLGILGIVFITILYMTIEKIISSDIYKIEHQKAEIILKTIEPTLATNYFLELEEENKEFAQKILQNEDILGLCIFFNGKPIFSKIPKVQESEQMILEYPIKDIMDGQEIGHILLHYTKSHYDATVKTLHVRFILMTSLIIFVIIIIYFVVRYMFSSLVKISSVVENYKIGNEISFEHINREVETDKVMNIISNLVKRVNEHNEQMQHKQEELEDAREKAEKANKFKSEFLANMSHEIRTPMNGVLGFVEQLSKTEKDKQRLKQFNIIKNSGQTLLSIINDILDFSKIESGKMELESHPYDVGQLMSDTAEIFGELTNSKKIKLTSNIDENLPKCLMIDQVRLKQVVFNLLSNAVKFTPENGSVTLDVKYNQKDKTMLCSVIDTGIGIAKENLEKIFEAFSQEESSTTRKFGGTGLGLSISSKLIYMMGSQLKVQSTLGEGSKFYFELPLVECQKELEKQEQNEDSDINENQTFNGHVLIVEDNATNQVLMSLLLEEFGVTYDMANDGVESLKWFNEKEYDIVLMDENMPNMNGIEATKHIRKTEIDKSLKHTPIVAVTANAMTEDKQRFIDAGMDDYISKPYSEKDIRNVLGKYLTDKK
jgi:signal transduction histidine kinase/CheY-like chemotaxis protein